VLHEREAISRASTAIDASTAARLVEVQQEAEQAPRDEELALLQRGEEAASRIDLDEAETRALIDQQLRDRGWEVDTKLLRAAPLSPVGIGWHVLQAHYGRVGCDHGIAGQTVKIRSATTMVKRASGYFRAFGLSAQS
jgi:hypothetical protein